MQCSACSTQMEYSLLISNWIIIRIENNSYIFDLTIEMLKQRSRHKIITEKIFRNKNTFKKDWGNQKQYTQLVAMYICNITTLLLNSIAVNRIICDFNYLFPYKHLSLFCCMLVAVQQNFANQSRDPHFYDPEASYTQWGKKTF